MFSKFQAFQSFLSNFKATNSKLNDIVKDYYYLYIANTLDQELTIDQNLTNSSVIMINHYKDQSIECDELHFIIVFRKTVIIIKRTLLPNLQPFFHKKDKLKICFFKDTKNVFDESISIKYEEIKVNEFFKNEVSAISKNFFNIGSKKIEYEELLNTIKISISGYLIQQSYCDLNYCRAKDFNSKSEKEINPREMNEDELIELRTIGTGGLFQTSLYYHIYDEKLYAIKKPNAYDNEIEKLLKRERLNYTKIKHPFIPKYYGTVKINKNDCLVIEFINGSTLSKEKCSQMSISERFTIILQLLSVIKYLHVNKFIYRDLKPNNVIIDQNQTLVVIDFDRMIENANINGEFNDSCTNDFNSIFNAPEINSKYLTILCDIYSFGKMINEIIPDMNNNEYYSNIYEIYLLCININPAKRPIATSVFISICIFIISKQITLDFSLAFNQNDSEMQYNIGFIYFSEQYNIQDINKAIYYFKIAADQNYPTAQLILGDIYYGNKYIKQDINKAIRYFTLAANHNIPQAHFYLGIIYYECQTITKDINKAIHFFTFAADQNIPQAQYNLGLIYYESEYIQIDINKSIYYLTLAANNNYPKAQYKLGIIYYEGQYIQIDINKSIYYLTLAANNNYSNAQYRLGIVYSEGQYIQIDINKSIYYLTLAANNNHSIAQYRLGIIYSEGLYIPRDINKSIYYLTLAANNNHPDAQYRLGIIYSEGLYIPRDINKAIYFYEQASNQNHQDAQFDLGLIYYEGQYVLQNINKSIYYFILAAKNNQIDALINLGVIYYEDKYIPRDINKSIYYLTLAANDNHSIAQYRLGIIYSEGRFIPRDINKAIYYLTLAANNNYSKAQYNLGLIYSEGKYIQRDINKAIHFFKQASNQNHSNAQYNLGLIYSEGKHIQRDINKAIYFFKQASNQDHTNAQCNLGFIYYEGQYVLRNINKSIYYFSLAANKNSPRAQFILGLIYYEGQYVLRNINKSLYFCSLAANQNYPNAQYILGLIYYNGIDVQQNINIGIYWITRSSNNDNIYGHFALGFLYQEGKYMKRNIDEAIKFYKKASSFNNQYAKNNLGVIYKNYFKNKYDYTVYFEEAIKQENDRVSMYNLSHAYIYEFQKEELINKSIELLIKSSNLGLKQSTGLLCLMILKKLINKKENEDEKIIIEDIVKKLSYAEKTSEIIFSFIGFIQECNLYHQSLYEYYYRKFEEIEIIYDLNAKPIIFKGLYNNENELKHKYSNDKYNISSDFYEGFGK